MRVALGGARMIELGPGAAVEARRREQDVFHPMRDDYRNRGAQA
jgi:hypothetical protein